MTASTSTVESSPTIVPLKLPTMLSAVILGALMAPVAVIEPALTAFEVALKKLELSVALTSPLKVPVALMAPVALFKITVLSSPMMLALTDPALISSVTAKVPKCPCPHLNTLEPTFLALSTSGNKCDSILAVKFKVSVLASPTVKLPPNVKLPSAVILPVSVMLPSTLMLPVPFKL